MVLTEWNDKVRKTIEKKYPKLEGKTEGIAFCAAILEHEPDLRLNDVKAMGHTFAPKLNFSPISISSAEVAMGRRAPKPRRRKRDPIVVIPRPPAVTAKRPSRLAKIEKKLVSALEVIDRYERAQSELEAARQALRKLNPSVANVLGQLDDDAGEVLRQEGVIK